MLKITGNKLLQVLALAMHSLSQLTNLTSLSNLTHLTSLSLVITRLIVRVSCVIITLVLMSPLAQAQTNCVAPLCYDSQDQGWFYYNWQLPVNNTETPTQLQPASPPTPAPVPALPPSKSTPSAPLDRLLTDADMAPVPTMISSAWLKLNLPKYLELAIDDPTDKHVLAYLYLQAYAAQKASQFSDRAKIVSQGNNILDSNGVFPNLSSSRQYRQQLAQHIKEKLFIQNNKKFGLILLVGNDYESRSFAQLVGLLTLKYDIKFELANLTGKYLNDLSNYRQITDVTAVTKLAQKLNTQVYPTLYIVDKNSTQILVSGSADMEELEARLLRWLYYKQLINYAEYNMARGIIGETLQTSTELSKLINTNLIPQEQRPHSLASQQVLTSSDLTPSPALSPSPSASPSPTISPSTNPSTSPTTTLDLVPRVTVPATVQPAP